MMCSPRELHLPNAPQKRGIIELDDAEVAGTPLILLVTGTNKEKNLGCFGS